MSAAASTAPSTPQSRPGMARVAGAACVGTTIEFYDFFIFGTATALVFGSVFFSELGGGRGALALGATYAVAFVARPIGSVLFGHIGDRLGRKRTLIYTLSLMGLSTFAIGCIPSYDAIGVAAPFLLVMLRFLQGLAVGGEWAGAALLTAEFAPPRRRGLYGMFPQLGAGLAFGLASATFLVVFEVTGDPTKDDAFQTWGWRVPFLASIVLVGVGLYMRLKIEETPVFREVLDAHQAARVPVRDAFAAQWRRISLVAGALSAFFAFVYIGIVFVTGYAGRNPKGVPPGVLGLTPQTILTGGIVAAAVYMAGVAVSAAYSDRVGRRRALLLTNLAGVPVALVAFPIMERGGESGFVLGLCLLLVVAGLSSGPVPAYLPELFPARYRYTAAGVGFNLAGVLGGAVPILLAPAILDTWGSRGIGLYLAGMSALSAACLQALPGISASRAADLPTAEPDRTPVRPVASVATVGGSR